MSQKYAFQGEKKGTARAAARDVRISPKEAYEVANAIRGKRISRARQFLSNVVQLKEAVPYKRYNSGVPHRHGIGPGRYPRNVSKSMIKVLNEVEANAEALGMNSELLEISHLAVHSGREIRGGFKGSAQNTPTVHIEIVVREGEGKKVESSKVEGSEKEKKPVMEKKKEEKPAKNQEKESVFAQAKKMAAEKKDEKKNESKITHKEDKS